MDFKFIEEELYEKKPTYGCISDEPVILVSVAKYHYCW